MLTQLLAQVDPKTAEVAVTHIEKQPWVAVVIALAAICATMIAGLVWIARSVGPWIERREKASQDHITGLLNARGQESQRDLQQVAEKIGLQLENKIERVSDSISNVRADLARIAAKIGVAGVVLLLLTGALDPPEGSPVVLAKRLPRPADLCNPRCPVGQTCSGRICTKLARPKEPPKLAGAPATSSKPTPQAPKPVGPQSANYAVLSQSWTDGKDPFETAEPEALP